jgi:type IV fimbrial biogenesis protein FimT
MIRDLHGFTLVELMTVILISAILLTIGIPSFTTLIEKTRIRSTKEDLVELLRTARLTAVERRAKVEVCGSADGLTCGGSGWSDKIIAQQVDSSGTQVEVLGIIHVNNRAIVTKNNAANTRIDFIPSGWAPGDQSSFFVCKTGGGSDDAYRVVIAISGKVRTERFETGVSWSCA